jgi:biopolymer transport protein TolQ
MENAFSILGIWHNMGLFARGIVAVMLVMSLASVYVISDRWMLFSKSLGESRAFAARMGAMLGKGDLKAAAAAKLGTDVGYLGRVIGAGLTTYRVNASAKPDFVFESVARALERQGQRETQLLKRGIAVLATVASTAPFIGLLGTVMGIINSFSSMAKSGSGGLGTVSGGIAEALATTAVGLGVAILAVIAYNGLQGWVDARGVDISESSNEFLDEVAKKLAEGQAGASAEAAE